ncbi:Protein KINESIN LIGHT CHAIN-RELATED 1 [Asimina triloba]
MPGLVSVKTPPRLILPNDEQIEELRNPNSRSPVPRKTPSPSPSSSSRPKPSPKKKTPVATPQKLQFDDEAALDNPDLGPFLLKLARDTIANGDSPAKALEYSIRASKSFERCAPEGEPSLELAMSLHVVAAIYCSLGKYDEAVPALERAIAVPDVERGADHALAAFSGYMQLGDTHSMLGQLDRAVASYEAGMKIQIAALGEKDPRVAETCSWSHVVVERVAGESVHIDLWFMYLAEAHVQAMQFDEAEVLCHKTLEIHQEHGTPASLEEAADRRLMALICEAKGEYEPALEHLVLASMAMIANGLDNEVASIDIGIGDIYLSLARFDEAVFSYQKALTVLKSTKGDNHPLVASIFVRLADLYYRTGKLRESKSYCESALRIFVRPVPGTTTEEIAGGLTEISAIYEVMNEPEEALKLLQRAMKLLEDVPGHRSTVAGIEAQMGVMLYVVGRFAEARSSFEGAVAKLRASGERKSAFFGIMLNQMGLACIQLYKIDEAAELFEEARGILEQECGPHHPDTLGVYSNLAATYDAMGRVEDAIEVLEYVLKVREEKLGTANPDVDDEKKRLAELLKEAGRSGNRKAKSLENLLDTQRMKKEGTKRWAGLSFRT